MIFFSIFLIKAVIKTEMKVISILIWFRHFYWVYDQFIVIKLQDITKEKIWKNKKFTVYQRQLILP